MRFSGGGSPIFRYGLAVTGSALALLARVALDLYLGPKVPYSTFYAAVALAAWLGGFGPAALSTALGLLAADFFFVTPRYSFWVATTDDAVAALCYVAVALLFAALGHLIQKSRRVLEAEVQQRTAQLQTTAHDVAAEQRRFQNVLDMLPAYVVLFTPDYHVLFANRLFEERFGKSQGRRCYEYLFGRDEPCEICETYTVLKTSAPHHWEWTGPDGRDYDVYDLPFSGAKGPMILEMGVDITARKQTERSLQQSEEQLRLATAAANIGVWHWDISNDRLFWSDRCKALFGVPNAGELTYGGFERLMHPDDRARVNALVHEANAQKRDFDAEYRVVWPDGSLHWIAARGGALYDAHGHPVRMTGVVLDITGRKQSEQKLREQAALLDLAHDAIIVCDMQNRILFWNRGAQDAYGWSAEEAIGRISSELLQTRFPVSREVHVAVLRQSGEWEGELRHIRRGGAPVVVLSRWSLLRNDAGTPTAILEINRDITDRQRAEQEVLQAHRQVTTILESISDAFVAYDRQWHFTYVNAEAERGFDAARQNLLGRIYWEVFPSMAGTETERFYRQAMQERETVEFESCDPAAGKWYIQRIYPTDDGGISVYLHDVTSQKRATEELRRAGAYNRSLIEASMDPLVTIDADGRITDVNAGTEKATGCSRQELIGADFSDYFSDPERARAGYRQVFEQGQVQDYELDIRNRDGRLTPVLYNASLYRDASGAVAGIFAAARDITERKRAEAELHKLNQELEQRVAERTAELQASNRELEAFSYSVSHDLRAPLRAMDGFSRILLEEHGPTLPTETHHYLEVIRQNATRMGDLVDDLLAFSRLGRQPITVQPVAPAELARQALEDLRGEQAGRRVHVTIGELPPCEGDPLLLRQVFANLLSNALKYTRRRDFPSIEVGATTMGDLPPEKREPLLGESWAAATPVYFVKDNGVGFDMRYAGKLFGVFQRLHRAEDYEGTGVGLATVQRIIHRHGGLVWAFAAVDQGAAFYFIVGTQRDSKGSYVRQAS